MEENEYRTVEARRRWICGVGSSGYHNGVDCHPDDPHGGWGCGWYYTAKVPAPAPVEPTVVFS
jgi:hypothetical protein